MDRFKLTDRQITRQTERQIDDEQIDRWQMNIIAYIMATYTFQSTSFAQAYFCFFNTHRANVYTSTCLNGAFKQLVSGRERERESTLSGVISSLDKVSTFKASLTSKASKQFRPPNFTHRPIVSRSHYRQTNRPQ